MESWSIFHQQLTGTFYAQKSQKRKKQSINFELLVSAHLKAKPKMLVKLTPNSQMYMFAHKFFCFIKHLICNNEHSSLNK
jgi:hypothetical protein